MEQRTTAPAGEEVHYNLWNLYKAIHFNNWDAAKAFIDEHPNALIALITTTNQTALHLAAYLGHEAMVEEMVRLVPPQCLEMVDDFHATPLASAVQNGDHTFRIAECMVNKNRNVLTIPSRNMHLPVTVAFANGHRQMGRYLYSLTPLECLYPENGFQGPLLLYWCFVAGDLDVALDLLQRCKELLCAEADDGWTPIRGIASMPYAFPSGTRLVFWKRWIYNYINIQSTTNINFVREDIQQRGQGRIPGLGLVQRIVFHSYNLLGIKEIYDVKLLHTRAAQILRLICDNVFPELELFTDALFCAAKEGIFEFVAEVAKVEPSIVFARDESTMRHMFFNAVEYRQAGVFNLIHGSRFKSTLTARVDSTRNTMLHVAGMLAPSSQINRISGAALQMQSELQWFKEVESVVPPGFRVQQNKDGMKAEDIFKENHKDLRKEGEKWMKGTASSCSVVGTLVVTIMFAAALTVPGGNNQNSGYPIFLEKLDKLFILFIVSDALSLFSSTTSVLMFLGILTSRYAEEDFLKLLPTKLILGLSALFVSIATMMIAFSTTILIMLKHRPQSWTLPLVIMLASVPVTIFVILQFPLLVQMVASTYGPGIFKRNVKSWQ